MATIADIRSDLVTRTAEITGLQPYDSETDRPVTPCLMVGEPRRIEYNTTLGPNFALYEFPLLLLVGRADLGSAVDQMNPYLQPTGTQSIKQAVEDKTVAVTSGWVLEPVVTETVDIGSYDVGGSQYLGATIICEVIG